MGGMTWVRAACSSKEAIWLSLSRPVLYTPSANPDKSTSDLHHSSPQASINKPLTHSKAYPDLAGYRGDKNSFFLMNKHQKWRHADRGRVASVSHQGLHTWVGTHPGFSACESSHAGQQEARRPGECQWMHHIQWMACPLQQSSLIMVGFASTGIELAANIIDNSHRLSCCRE